MEVYLDTQPVDELTIDGANLEDMLVDIMSSHIPQGRILSEVLIDGRTYNEEMPSDAAEVDRTGIARLDLVTVPAADLAKILVESGPEHLAVISEAARKLADDFRLADEAEANEKFTVFIQTLQDFFAFLGQTLDVLAIPLAELETDGLSATTKLQELTRILTEISVHQEDCDWILLADLLEYELEPVLRDWQTILAKVKTVVH